MQNKMFSLQKESSHIKLNIFGIKLRFKHFFNRKMYNHFMLKEVKEKTILIIELNSFHYETILGICKCCLDLGYNVDILTRDPAEKIFQYLSFENVRVYECTSKTFDKIYNDYDFSQYERIIYNSKRAYFINKNKISPCGCDISECYKVVKRGQKPNIYLQHHLDKIIETPNDIQIILGNPSKHEDWDNLVVDLNYFRTSTPNFKNKNNITNFISVGELSKKRRNFSLLVDAVDALHNQKYTNFKVTVIGRGKIEDIPEDLKQYFSILGRVDYPKLYKELQEADYVLPLLDPSLEEHRKYMSLQVSGTALLIYNFYKPCLIHKAFADVYNLSDSTSLVYEDNSDFANYMKKAIDLENDKYIELQKNLYILDEEIHNKSVNNLKRLLLNE